MQCVQTCACLVESNSYILAGIQEICTHFQFLTFDIFITNTNIKK